MDESGISVGQHKLTRIVTAKEKKKVHELAAAKLDNHLGHIVRKFQIAILLREADLKASTMQTAVNGFINTTNKIFLVTKKERNGSDAVCALNDSKKTVLQC